MDGKRITCMLLSGMLVAGVSFLPLAYSVEHGGKEHAGADHAKLAPKMDNPNSPVAPRIRLPP
jgi:hypothetical protein